jgi:hypothetical protein
MLNMTIVENWCQLPDGQIEFMIRQLPTADQAAYGLQRVDRPPNDRDWTSRIGRHFRISGEMRNQRGQPPKGRRRRPLANAVVPSSHPRAVLWAEMLTAHG